MRAEATDARIVLAFPDAPTYNHLGKRVNAPGAASGIELWLVGDYGAVTELAEP